MTMISAAAALVASIATSVIQRANEISNESGRSADAQLFQERAAQAIVSFKLRKLAGEPISTEEQRAHDAALANLENVGNRAMLDGLLKAAEERFTEAAKA